jgi:acetyl-CoA synthetase
MADTQDKKGAQSNEAQIAVHWKEEELYHPNPKFVAQANLTDESINERFSEKNFPQCFEEYANMLDWYEKWHTVLDTNDPPFWKWFVGGKINASYNCVDRHLAKYGNKAAVIFVPEPEDEPAVVLTFQELYNRVNETAALLRDFCGLETGDRVTIHMPMITELPITMLACARLGVIHSVVFGGFSGEACGMRAADSGSEVLIYADGYYRGGKMIDHKASAEIACDIAEKEGQKIKKVLVWRRYAGKYCSNIPMKEGRDYFVDDVLKQYRGAKVDPVPVDSEHPLFLMYTSGTTGKPKGCQHRTGGFLAYTTGTSKYIQDIHPEDVYWCMADIGWITGHSYIVYGPLALAASTVIYEGVPVYVANRRATGCQHLPHLPDRHPHAEKSRWG